MLCTLASGEGKSRKSRELVASPFRYASDIWSFPLTPSPRWAMFGFYKRCDALPTSLSNERRGRSASVGYATDCPGSILPPLLGHVTQSQIPLDVAT